ncbi:MAG TPA: quinone-dependent dihydroorotate dehydrogenase, partial [Solirubrobacterales bacterium]
MIYRACFGLLVALRIDAETAHRVAAFSLRALTAPAPVLRALHRLLAPRHPALRVKALGLDFATPLGCAAGVDKSGTWFEALHALGFGAVEVGSVTAVGQDGNPRPRVARLPRERALVNAMGFPNEGAAAVAQRLGRRRLPGAVVGVNVGKTMTVDLADAVEDYRRAVRAVAPVADYLVLNVSSPNTPGLRRMQAAEQLIALFRGAREEAESVRPGVPLLVKISPDLDDAEVDAVAAAALEVGADGIVAVNTTVDRSVAPGSESCLEGRGGISGAPLQARAVAVLKRLHERVGGRLPIVSVGGIETAEDAWERILAGASLIQTYTGFVYGGPLWPRRVNRGLSRLLRESGFASIEAAVGQGRAGSAGSGAGSEGSRALLVDAGERL